MFPSAASTGVLTQRIIDPNAIDITSLKGQFAWEKIPQCDTHMPVIFRGDTKYFCVRMLRKILPEYPEDVLRRSYQYHYRKPIDIYSVTAYEVDLLNRINSHHSRWTYSRQPFTALDEIVRVTDFIPFYEHLRGVKSSSGLNPSTQALRQILPQSRTHPNVQRPPEPTIAKSTMIQRQSTAPPASHTQIQPYALPTNSRPTVSVSNGRPPKSLGNPYAVVLPQRVLQPPMPLSTHIQQSTPVLTNNMINCANTVPTSNISFVSNTISTPMVSATNVSSSSPTTSSTSPNLQSSIHYSPSSSSSPILPSTTPTLPATTNRKLSTSSSTASLPPPPTPSSTTSSSSSSTTITSNTSSSTKLNRLHSGWLQVNKLYTPYISTSATNHHLYKLPVSLLTFYDLLKFPSMETNDPTNESLLPHEQTIATSQELELINELCAKQNIKPFDTDTKLIPLSAFYRYTTANMIFVKELPMEEPKASICKDWSSIVQINGGICRLRNIKTLHEQTVPFIGSNLLKNFLLSSHCLLNASLTKPTSSELEFLQLILFFSNLSMNLPNCQLIDIESVKKEYNVDLILLFNDKFPLNVLNYQQGNRLNNTSGTIIPTNPTAPTNTIAESTPPPSPPSSPTNPPQSNSTSQLPLTASSSSSSVVAAAQNRYHKTIQFHGHTLTAFVCSGIGPNTQRECVSIRSLCNILYPDSPALEKLEMKMLRLLRSKNINRFRPQNQSSLGFTRLIDVNDAEKHWDYLEQEMHTVFNDNHSSPSTVTNSDANSNIETERVENSEPVPTEKANKGEKRPLEETMDEEDIPVLERINKRVRFAAEENHSTVTDNTRDTVCPLTNGGTRSDDHSTDKPTEKRPIKIILPKLIKKRALPSNRTNRNSRATWTKRYNIEDFCILLDKCDSELISERD